jgi:hypothetical protein
MINKFINWPYAITVVASLWSVTVIGVCVWIARK